MSVSAAAHLKPTLAKTGNVQKSTVGGTPQGGAATSTNGLNNSSSNVFSFPALPSASGFTLSNSSVVSVSYGPGNCFKYVVNTDTRSNVLLDIMLNQVRKTLGGILGTKLERCTKQIQQLTSQSAQVGIYLRAANERLNKNDNVAQPPASDPKESLSTRLSQNRQNGKFLSRKKIGGTSVLSEEVESTLVFTSEELSMLKDELVGLQRQTEDAVHVMTATKSRLTLDLQALESITDVVLLDAAGQVCLSRFAEDQGFQSDEKTAFFADPFVAAHVSNAAALHRTSPVVKPSKFKVKETPPEPSTEQFVPERSGLTTGQAYSVSYVVQTDAPRTSGPILPRLEGHVPSFVLNAGRNVLLRGHKEYSISNLPFTHVQVVLPDVPVVSLEKYKHLKKHS